MFGMPGWFWWFGSWTPKQHVQLPHETIVEVPHSCFVEDDCNFIAGVCWCLVLTNKCFQLLFHKLKQHGCTVCGHSWFLFSGAPFMKPKPCFLNLASDYTVLFPGKTAPAEHLLQKQQNAQKLSLQFERWLERDGWNEIWGNQLHHLVWATLRLKISVYIFFDIHKPWNYAQRSVWHHLHSLRSTLYLLWCTCVCHTSSPWIRDQSMCERAQSESHTRDTWTEMRCAVKSPWQSATAFIYRNVR